MKYNYPKVSFKKSLGLLSIPLIFLVVVIGMDLLTSHNYRNDGPWIGVRKGAKMFSYFGNDTIVTPLAAGDSVKVLGYLDWSNNGRLLVETPSGYRGALYYWWADIDVITGNPNLRGDTIRMSPPKKVLQSKYGMHYGELRPKGILVRTGQEVDVDRYSYYPAIKDFAKYEIQDRHNYSKIMSQGKFQRIADNLSFADAEKRVGPMKYIARNASNDIEVRFRTFVFNPSDGKFYYPILTFGPDSVAVATRYDLATDRGSWALKYLPLAPAIYDLPLTTFLTRTGVYDEAYLGSDFEKTGFKKFLGWVGTFISMIFGLVWVFAVGAVPMCLIYWILYYPRVLYVLSDTGVLVVMAILGAVVTYYWMIALMAWGAYWWAAALMIGATYYIWDFFNIMLEDSVPHTRCQNCRAMDTMYLDEEEFLHSTHDTEIRTKSTQIGQTSTTTKEWTDIYRGNQKVGEKDHRRTVDTDTTYRDDDYEEQVRYDNYKLHYKCSVCGHKERGTRRSRHVLSSKFKGSSTRTERSTKNYNY